MYLSIYIGLSMAVQNLTAVSVVFISINVRLHKSCQLRYFVSVNFQKPQFLYLFGMLKIVYVFACATDFQVRFMRLRQRLLLCYTVFGLSFISMCNHLFIRKQAE